MSKMLVVGDINVDIMMGGLASLPVVDREITCQSFEVTMGSSAVIFAVTHSCLGGETAFCGLAGKDEHGDLMLKGMRDLGIQTDLVQVTDEVRTGVTVNLIYQNTRTQVTYPGTIAAFDGAGLDESSLRRFDHVHFAGPYQQTHFRPKITALLAKAHDLAVSTSLDPQWDETGRWEYMDEWLPLLSYLFVNEDEAVSISGASQPEEALGWLASRTACPVIKRGREGAMLRSNGDVLSASAMTVEPVDTTGAGDTFDAAFLFALLQKEMSRFEAAEFANAAAARSCLFVGGVNARSSFEDVVQFRKDRQ